MAEDIMGVVAGIIGAIILAWVFIAVLAPAFAQISPQSSAILVLGSVLIIVTIIAAVLKTVGVSVI